MPQLNDVKRVGILGAGAGGTATALELAKRGFLVDLFDKNGEILLGSSNATPGRAGHGFHYIHPETGILYLDSTIEILKEFPGCLLGAGKDPEHYLRHGLYFIMKEGHELNEQDQEMRSLFPANRIVDTYSQLKDHYRKKISEDPDTKLFGEPDQFYQMRHVEEFEGVVDTSKVKVVVDTREELLDWPKVRNKLRDRMNIHPNITVHTSTLVKDAHYSSNGKGFVINTNRGEVPVDYVINASWENIEAINHGMGFYMQPESRTIRLKGIVKVILPEGLTEKSSMFFCMGAHCMFSNMGDGTGRITYAPITNIYTSTAIGVSKEIRRFLNGEANQEEKMGFAKKVLEGVSLYIPAMKEAIIEDVGFGIIKTLGDVDVFDAESQFHRRDYLGVQEQQIGWIDNACMKLLYFLRNAKLVAELMEQHVKASECVERMSKSLTKETQLANRNDGEAALAVYLQRHYDSQTLLKQYDKLAEVLGSVIAQKALVQQEIKRTVSFIEQEAYVTEKTDADTVSRSSESMDPEVHERLEATDTISYNKLNSVFYSLRQTLDMWRQAPSPSKVMTTCLVLTTLFFLFKMSSGCDKVDLSFGFWAGGEERPNEFQNGLHSNAFGP